jgi:VanZ family protein
MIRENKAVKIIFPVLTIACVAFIWIHSTMDGVQSADESGGLLETIKALLSFMPFAADLTEHILRKLAHFTEFSILGFLLATDTLLFMSNPIKKMNIPAFVGLLVALTDETIQFFIPGRSSQVTDVWIDFMGVCFGIVILVLVNLYVTGKRKEK